MEVLLLPEAEDDIRAAWSWYVQEAAGMEVGFLAALERCFERVREYPLGFPCVDGEIRRALVRPFPYAVSHVEGPSAIIVLGCNHGSRDLPAWKRRR